MPWTKPISEMEASAELRSSQVELPTILSPHSLQLPHPYHSGAPAAKWKK